MNGHNHAGNYGTKNKIHYLTLKGMVDTTSNAFPVIEVYENRLFLKGIGRQKNREMKLISTQKS